LLLVPAPYLGPPSSFPTANPAVTTFCFIRWTGLEASLIVPGLPSRATKALKSAWLAPEAQPQAVPFQAAVCPFVQACGSRKLGAIDIETSPLSPPPVRPAPAASDVTSPLESL